MAMHQIQPDNPKTPKSVVPNAQARMRGAEAEDDGGGLDIRALMRFFQRRQWIILSVGFLVAALFAGVTMMQPKRYTATALVLISPQSGDIARADQAGIADQNLDAGAIESQIELLRTRKLMGLLSDRLQLTKDPEWNPALGEKGPIATLKTMILGAKPERQDAQTQRQIREAIIDRILWQSNARRRGLTYVVEVSVTTLRPQQSARMANELVALYFQEQVRARYDASQKANAWLSGRLESLRAEVQQKEAAVEAYRAESGLLTAQGASLTEQQITGMQGSVLQARTEVAERQARFQQVQQIIRSGGSADSVAAVINSETIRVLRAQESEAARRQADLESRYGDLHPSIATARQERAGIQAQIDLEVQRIAANLKNEVEVARARLAMLEGSQSSMQGQLVENNSGMVRLRELERDAGATRAIYEAFLRRYQEISGSVSLEVTDAQLVGPAAIPNGHSSPKLSLALMLGIVLGAVIGIGSGLVVEFMDEGLDDVKKVESETGKRVLAAIPMVKVREVNKNAFENFRGLADSAVKVSSFKDLTSFAHRSGKLIEKRLGQVLPWRGRTADGAATEELQHPLEDLSPARYLVDKPMSAFAEGFRSLRTSLLYSGGASHSNTIAVASAMPGEGKTTTSICLARVSGLSGQRVIAVDCDLRRRSLSTLMGSSPQKGLLQVLKGETTWRDVVARDAISSVDILPAAEGSFTPWDVFGSPAMQKLLDELSEEYDLVLLDCPPVLAVAESRIICGLVQQTVLVVRWASTPARAALSAIEQIEQCGGLVGGIALNCVDSDAPGRGAYGDSTYQARYAGAYYSS
jgi:succinoglycan biosynthesis transport protein ExoP